jgi:D-arabinose 1-dehydrogenase-like Zn-dependent alcohol dehydrogenase
MRAPVQSVVSGIVLHDFGPAENLLYEEVPDPVPGEGQVRIAVEAAGVHLIDTTLARSHPQCRRPPDPSMIGGATGEWSRIAADGQRWIRGADCGSGERAPRAA